MSHCNFDYLNCLFSPLHIIWTLQSYYYLSDEIARRLAAC